MHVPGWHEATKALQDDGTIQMVGIIQEQHPDRARLFMRWKKMGWPILVDSYNLLEAPYVPITLAIDERGVIVRQLRTLRDEAPLDEDFVSETFAAAEAAAEPDRAADVTAEPAMPDLAALELEARGSGDVDAWREYASAVAVWGREDRVDAAIAAFDEVVRQAPDDGVAHFRLGVAYRERHDSDDRRDLDFRYAVEHWGAALAIDPNQYIWRRRIQQYGPRLDKPYPFYDWVPTAREEIRARGEEPPPLAVEPRGSEFAQPLESFAAEGSAGAEPDPLGRVLRDGGDFVRVETTAVPAEVAPGEAVRVHLAFRPILERLAHWNNEAGDMVLWVEPPPGWEVERRLSTYAVPRTAVSQETRTIEIEVRPGSSVAVGPVEIPAYALYYVCEDIDGICMYRRQDVGLEVSVKSED